MKWENKTNQRTNKSKKQGDKGKRRGEGVYDWSHFGLCEAESSDLMFSIVSSGMGATVCTAGRFLLVAPLTNDEEEEEDEEAESVAPGWEARGARAMKKSNVSQRRETAVTEVGTQGNNGANVLMSDQMRPNSI